MSPKSRIGQSGSSSEERENKRQDLPGHIFKYVSIQINEQ